MQRTKLRGKDSAFSCPGRKHSLLPALATNVPPARLLNASRPLNNPPILKRPKKQAPIKALCFDWKRKNNTIGRIDVACRGNWPYDVVLTRRPLFGFSPAAEIPSYTQFGLYGRKPHNGHNKKKQLTPSFNGDIILISSWLEVSKWKR